MSTLARILVIILCILSLAFVLVSLKTYGEIDTQANMISTLLTSSGEQKATVDSMNTAIGSAKEKITSLTEEVEAIKLAKTEIDAALEAEKNANAEVEQKLKPALTKVNLLKKKVETYSAYIAKLKSAYSKLKVSHKRSKASASKLTSELNSIKSIIAANPERWQKMIDIENSKKAKLQK